MSHGSGKSAVRVAREASAGCGEMALVELPAIDLLTSLGWCFKNLYVETFGELGSEGHMCMATWPCSARRRAEDS